MKKLLFIVCVLAGFSYAKAQAPQGISYQAAVRNAVGLPLANIPVKVRFSILDSVANGPVVYKETHTTTTNAGGLFNVNVGLGTAITGTLAGVNWGSNAKFLQVEIDTTATGNNFTNMGVQQLMSVPYALYAGGISAGLQGNNNSQILPSNVLIFNDDPWWGSTILTWSVPVGVTRIQVECWGAGGYGYPNHGGGGGYAKSYLNVIPGSQHQIEIGGTVNLNNMASGLSRFDSTVIAYGGYNTTGGTGVGQIVIDGQSTNPVFSKGGDSAFGGWGATSSTPAGIGGGWYGWSVGGGNGRVIITY